MWGSYMMMYDTNMKFKRDRGHIQTANKINGNMRDAYLCKITM